MMVSEKNKESINQVFGTLFEDYNQLSELGLADADLKKYFNEWSNTPACIVSEKGILLFINSHFIQLCGFTKEELLNLPSTIVSDETIESDEIKKRLAERRKGLSSKYNMTIKEKSGKKILVSVYATPVINASKKFIGSLLCIKDIDRQKQEEEGLKKSMESLESEVEKRTRALTIANYHMVSEIKERKLTEEALKNSEKRFKDLFYSSPEAIFVEDFEGNVIDVNDSAAILHGVSREELIGTNVIKFSKVENPEEFIERQKKLVTGELTYFETEITHSSKKRIPIAVKSAIIDFNGQFAILLHARDISERIEYQRNLEKKNLELDEKVKERTSELEDTNKKLQKEIQFGIYAQNAINRQKDFLQMLIDVNPNQIFLKNKKGEYIMVNESFARFYSKEKDKIFGLKYDEINPRTNNIQDFIEQDRLVLENPDSQFEFTADIFVGDGLKPHHIKIYKLAIKDPESDEYNILGICVDITEMRNNEIRLQNSQNLYRQIASNVPNSAIFVFDKQLRYVLAEGSLVGKISLPKEQIEGKHVLETGETEEVLNERFERYSKILNGYSEIIQTTENESSFLVNANPIRDENGEVIYGLVVILDITELKKTQIELEENNIKLAQSNEELERFAYVASHDLQSPLKTIISFLQLLDQRYGSQVNTDGKEFIDYCISASSRMRQLISDLLNYSRLNTEPRPFEWVEMSDIMFIVTKNLESNIDAKKATIEFSNLPKVFAEPYKLTQILQNLVDNAMKFVKDNDPKILVYGSETPTHWQISVQDNGIGIKDEFKEKIFLIFQRLHNDTEYSGTGIGLAICKKVVDIHHGQIWVDSEIGVGTTFHFTISKSLHNKPSALN
jgi:PAS domain S-box-containing protein